MEGYQGYSDAYVRVTRADYSVGNGEYDQAYISHIYSNILGHLPSKYFDPLSDVSSELWEIVSKKKTSYIYSFFPFPYELTVLNQLGY